MSLRVGLVGCGRLAELGYAPAAAASAGVRLTALADPDAERRTAVALAARRAGAEAPPRCHPSAAAMLRAGGMDAVIVASPPALHEEHATLAAAAGLPSLVEKPPAPDAAGAARIAELDPPPHIGFNRRFSLGRGLAGSLPPGGSLELELRYRRFAWSPVSVRDPALTDLAPHLVDLALLAGLVPERVAARSGRPERVAIELAGARGRATIRCACDRPHLERAEVRDAGGTRVERRRSGGALRTLPGRLSGRPHPIVASLRDQLDAFAAACAGRPNDREAPLASAADGLAAMRVVAAAGESLALGGRPVPLEQAEAARA